MRQLLLIAPLMAGCAMFKGPNPQQAQAQAMAAAGDAAAGANAAAFSHSDAERDRFIVKWTADYEPLGDPIEGKLEAFQPVPVKMERGKCYMMVLKLGSEARWSEHAQKGISFMYATTSGEDVNGGPGVHGAGGVGSGGCPLSDADATFDMQAYFGSAMDKSRIHELGQGAYSLQLMTKSITEEEIAALEADRERQIEESRRFQEEQQRKEAQRAAAGCAKCQEGYLECLAEGKGKSNCQRERDSCAFMKARLSSYRECG